MAAKIGKMMLACLIRPDGRRAREEAFMKSNQDALPIDENRRLLNRYRFIEQRAMRIFTGWLPKAARFELKCELGRTLWEDAQHVNALYLRLREVQSPAFQDPDDAALVRLMDEMQDAPGEFALAAAFWRVLKPALVACLRGHEKMTFPNSDLPSVYAIGHIVLDETGQLDRMRPLLEEWERAGKIDAAAREWEEYARALLAAAGGISGREPRTAAPAPSALRQPFAWAREAGRDERFIHRGADSETVPPEEDYAAHTVEEFERYSTEMAAAETVANIAFRLTAMPWEFYLDAARHLYDEVRHCLMGYEWMRRHGLDPFQSPQYLHIYKWRSQFDPVTQYCLLTMGNEVNAFPYRHRRVAAHQQSGDWLSEQFVRYDIADETQHVRFGRRWLPEMLQLTGEKRSFDDYTADVLKIWEREYKTGKLTLQVE
jgi:hypothetical protein